MRTELFALFAVASFALVGFGPCSGDDANKVAPPKPTAAATATAKADDLPPPVPLGQDWTGELTGTTPEGGTWKITVKNCGVPNIAGPWTGTLTFSVNTQGVSMNGSSTDWPAVTLGADASKPTPFTVKSKVTASGPVKMNMDTTTQLEGWLEGTQFFVFKEKAATGALKASAPNGMTASWFGGGEGNKTLKIPLKPGTCGAAGAAKKGP